MRSDLWDFASLVVDVSSCATTGARHSPSRQVLPRGPLRPIHFRRQIRPFRGGAGKELGMNLSDWRRRIADNRQEARRLLNEARARGARNRKLKQEAENFRCTSPPRERNARQCRAQ